MSGIFLPFWNWEKHLDHQKWEELKLDRHFRMKLAVSSCNIFVALIALDKTYENLHKNVNENRFSFIFMQVFMDL